MSKKQPPKKLKQETEKQPPRKTYQFRIYPTSKQINVLETWLGLCCDTYNAALDERKSAYDDFFWRVSDGQKPGFPRFKSRFRYDSLTFKQYKNSFNVFESAKKNKGTLVLAKLGHVKMVMHRPIKGTPKTAIVKRTPTGKWFVSLSVEIGEEEARGKCLPACTEEVGIDVGLSTFAYLSTGEEIANPRFFCTEEAALAHAQRKLSKAPKGSREREHRRKVVARVHERISNRRTNFIEQLVASLIKRFGFLAVEA
jgi:putative transposase